MHYESRKRSEVFLFLCGLLLSNGFKIIRSLTGELRVCDAAVSCTKHEHLADLNVQSDGKTMQLILDLLKMLMPSIVDNYQQTSAVGSLIRAQQALKSLKTLSKTVESTEQLMVWN
jgi:hypothetical protein